MIIPRRFRVSLRFFYKGEQKRKRARLNIHKIAIDGVLREFSFFPTADLESQESIAGFIEIRRHSIGKPM